MLPEYKNLILDNLLFEGINRDSLLNLDFTQFKEINFDKGEIFIEENTPGEEMYLVASGKVSVSKTVDGLSVYLGSRSSGECVGEIALLDNQLRSASVTTVESCKLFSLNKSYFNILLEKYDKIKTNIIKGISASLRDNGVRISVDSIKYSKEINNIKELLNETLELKRAIDEQRSELELINRELENKNRELFRLTIIDDLTNCYSKSHFNKLLDSELSRSLRHDIEFTLLLIDIDHYKLFNDTYGHIVGDKLLVELVSFIQGSLRKEDILGRIGGEEFAIILPHMTIDKSKIVAEKLRESIEEKIFNINNIDLQITVSIGISNSIIDTPTSIEEMLHNSDIALYKAKNRGRNRVEIYESGLSMNKILAY